MNQLIADGHKVCNLLDTGQGDVIAPYIERKYDASPTAGIMVFPYKASVAYCPWHRNMFEEN